MDPIVYPVSDTMIGMSSLFTLCILFFSTPRFVLLYSYLES